MPEASMPTRVGWNSTSGHLNRSLPMVITCQHAKQMSCQLPHLVSLTVMSHFHHSGTVSKFCNFWSVPAMSCHVSLHSLLSTDPQPCPGHNAWR